MAQNKNHHFVPQYYFKNFSENKKTINILIKKNGEIKKDISIKHQCSKNNFYLLKNIEKEYSKIENKHSKVLKIIDGLTSFQDYSDYLSTDILHSIFEYALFQKTRTYSELQKIKSVASNYIEEKIKMHFKGKYCGKLLNLILNNLKINLNKNAFQDILNQRMAHVIIYRKVIQDLKVYILNNKTKKEFIFSDDPSIFYNLAYRHIKNHCTISLQSPGLMIFFPISKSKCILLLDEEKYSGSLMNNYFFDILKETDISAINKLQIHSSFDSIYISNKNQLEYTSKLYREEKDRLKLSKQNININDSSIITPQQLNYTLHLSFIDAHITSKNIPKYRNQKLYKLLNDGIKVMNSIENDIKHYKRKKENISEEFNHQEVRNIILDKLVKLNI